jgi:Family of unknown function (DUF6703)
MSVRQPPGGQQRRPRPGQQRPGQQRPGQQRRARGRGLEKASARPIAFLHQLPRWLVPVVLAGLFVAGLAAAGWIGAIALGLVAAFAGWLASLSWPALHTPGRLLRVTIIALLLALALWQAGR